MNDRDSALRKVRRLAAASFENAVRLHEDAVLLFERGRIPSSLHTSALCIEEIGKYFMHEDAWWHNRTGSEWSVREIQEFLSSAYSHTAKHGWFAGQVYHHFASQALVKLLCDGQLERLKQRATYVGLPRRGKYADFRKRIVTPFRASKKLSEELITLVNDFFIELSLGVRKGAYGLDIPEVDGWLATEEFEKHFVDLWPVMRARARRRVSQLRKHPDAER